MFHAYMCCCVYKPDPTTIQLHQTKPAQTNNLFDLNKPEIKWNPHAL